MLGLGGCTATPSTSTVVTGGSTSEPATTVAVHHCGDLGHHGGDTEVAGPGFQDLATLMAPVPVFGMVAACQVALSVAPYWWPVIDGGIQRCHRARGEPAYRWARVQLKSPRRQLLLTCDDGWLVVIANFRGDLGDVAGRAVGSVAGMPAQSVRGERGLARAVELSRAMVWAVFGGECSGRWSPRRPSRDGGW